MSEAAEKPIANLVVSFISFWKRYVLEKNTEEVHNLYENSLNKLTERFFKNERWPHADDVSHLLDDNPWVMILYKELYYRHVYSKLTPTIQDRIGSWETYKELFDYILRRKRNIDLPSDLLWDIVDEFIYQAQSFNTYQLKFRSQTPEHKQILKDNAGVWSVPEVISYLNRIVEHSGVDSILSGDDADAKLAALPEGTAHFYGCIGAFSKIGLLRLHCLLGDYHYALKQVESFDLFNLPFISSVTPCHTTLFYYVGFANLMMRNHARALGQFQHILVFLRSSKQALTRSYQSEDILKKQDQILALLTMIVSLVPHRLDTQVTQEISDKLGDTWYRLKQGGPSAYSAYEELWSGASPKFISAVIPEDDGVNQHFKAHGKQKKLFLEEIKVMMQIPVLRSYLKLYTSIGVSKLAQFLGVDESKARAQLLAYKHKTRNETNERENFYIDGEMIHVNATKEAASYTSELLAAINVISC